MWKDKSMLEAPLLIVFVSCCFSFPWKRKPVLLGHCLRSTLLIVCQGETGCWQRVRSEVLLLLVEISGHISFSSHSLLVGQQVKLVWVAVHQHWSPVWIPEQCELADKGKDHVDLVSGCFTSGESEQFPVWHQVTAEASPLVAPYSRGWLCSIQMGSSRAASCILCPEGACGWCHKCLGVCPSLGI